MIAWAEKLIHRWWWPSLWHQIESYRKASDENYEVARNYNHELGLREKEIEKLEEEKVYGSF